MRYLVLILGLLGAAAAGYLGWRWYSDSMSPEVQFARELIRSLPDDPQAKAALAQHQSAVTASYFLLAGVPLGIAGAVLAFLRKGMLAGFVMLAAGLVPGMIQWRALVFTCFLLLAGGLSFLIKPAKV